MCVVQSAVVAFSRYWFAVKQHQHAVATYTSVVAHGEVGGSVTVRVDAGVLVLIMSSQVVSGT